MGLPRIVWDEKKLIENARQLDQMCSKKDVKWIAVTKCLSAHPEIVSSLLESGYSVFGDSRIKNLKKIKEMDAKAITYLIRYPAESEISDTVKWADYSLVSEWETIIRLNNEAKSQGKIYKIIIMIELGDRREGIMPEKLMGLIEKVISLSNIDWVGIGTNLTCYGGVIPTYEVLSKLIDLKKVIKKEYGHSLSILSGGNSSTIPLLKNNQVPNGINQLRLGESLLFGIESAYGEKIEGFHTDIFTLEVEVIEIQEKPSYPEGLLGGQVFGEEKIYTNRGIRKRAILAVGEQDIVWKGLTPVFPGIEMIGASSDHLILDITDYKEECTIGTVLPFLVNYEALLRAMTSEYVSLYRKRDVPLSC